MKFTRIPQDTFEKLQFNAGLLLNKFDPTGATEVQNADIITATTGGIHLTMVPEYSDLGEDVDNCPNDMKELKHLDGWSCTTELTALSVDPKTIRLALGAADIDGTDTTKIIPRRDLSQNDFADLWWVGDRADGGFVAVKLINALSTSGFDLQTTKNGKGQTAITLTGHVSMSDQDKMPMEFYSAGPDSGATPSILLNKHVVEVDVGDTVTLTADVTPSGQTVTWASGTTAKATVSGGTVTGVAAGSSVITATITVDSVDYTDTCTVIVKAVA